MKKKKNYLISIVFIYSLFRHLIPIKIMTNARSFFFLLMMLMQKAVTPAGVTLKVKEGWFTSYKRYSNRKEGKEINGWNHGSNHLDSMAFQQKPIG